MVSDGNYVHDHKGYNLHNRIAAMFLLTMDHIPENYQTKQYYDLCIALEKYLISNLGIELTNDLLKNIALTGYAHK